MLYVLQKLGFHGNKLKIIEIFLTIFTTITALQIKLQQKQFDLTLDIYSYLLYKKLENLAPIYWIRLFYLNTNLWGLEKKCQTKQCQQEKNIKWHSEQWICLPVVVATHDSYGQCVWMCPEC